jgi:hypothetical protein
MEQLLRLQTAVDIASAADVADVAHNLGGFGLVLGAEELLE